MAEKTSFGLQLRALSGNCPLWTSIPSCVIEAERACDGDGALSRGQVPRDDVPKKREEKKPLPKRDYRLRAREKTAPLLFSLHHVMSANQNPDQLPATGEPHRRAESASHKC